ncbi:MAG: hypothetical protein L0G81_14790, partial [Ewingella sp.]|nr:hypothetical protein [Ewingella sp.]
MKTFSTTLTHTLMAATLALSLGSLSFSASARAPDGWSSGAYAYSAQNTPLRTVLADFASSHGVTLKLGNVPEATVSGRLRADSAATFLDRLGLEYQFQWFVYNDMLYISPQSEQISKRIRVSSEAA